MFSVLLNYLENFKTEINVKTIRNLIIIVIAVILLSSFLILEVEGTKQFKNFEDAVWWSIVTTTTVGYGDKFPVTFGGRVIAIILMMIGIGTFGAITAELANLFIRIKRRKELGEMRAQYKNHLIICGWCKSTREVIEQSLSEENKAEDIVLVANIEKDPYPEEDDIHFVKGEIDDDKTLKKANVQKAKKVIILNEDNNDRSTVLSALTIESLNPDVYTIVEVMDKQNKIHFQNANVDEIIITNNLNSQLLVRTAFYSGTSNFIAELLSNQRGNEIYMFKPESKDYNQSFIDLLNKYKHEEEIIIVGIKRDGKIITNPANEEKIIENDELIYISENSIV